MNIELLLENVIYQNMILRLGYQYFSGQHIQ